MGVRNRRLTSINVLIDTNEIFRLAAKVFARVALDVRERGKTLEEALAPLRMFVKDYWWNVSMLEMASSIKEFLFTLSLV